MPMRRRTPIAAIVAAALLPVAASAQSGGLAQRLDSIAGADVAAGRSVGLVVAVVKGKDQLLLKPYGKADADAGAAMTANTVLPIGSVAKQFTAVAILQLRDAGKLGLDDDVTKWLPDFDTRVADDASGAKAKVTLRHLLGHTGGVKELIEMPELRAAQMMRNPDLTRDSLYQIIKRYPLQYAPGTMQLYSNTDYWLLGRIVEKASGMTYEDYIAKKIFEPIGMSRSIYCGNVSKVTDRAFGYGMRSGTPRRVADIVHTDTYAAGAVCSTAGDMVTWLQALHGGKLLTPKSYAEMTTPTKLNDGTSTLYGMGLVVWRDNRGLREIGHNGGGFGFSSQAWWHPDTQLAMVLLTNSEPDNTTAITEELAVQVLGPARNPAFAGDASQLVGTYKGRGRGKEMVATVSAEAGGLAVSVDGAPAKPLQWIEGLTFRLPTPRLTFQRSGSSGPASVLHFDTAGDHFVLKRQ